nr:NAD(+)/NADH kinase [Saprospiraceae bacterium]
MMRVLVYAQKLKEVDFHIIKHFFDLLLEYDFKIGVNTTLGEILHDPLIGVNETGFEKVANTSELINFAPDVLITLGGDGTILSAISFIRDTGIPIMGINLGRLGFLASVEKAKIEMAIKAVAKRNFKLEKRTLLKIDCDTPIFGDMPFALNDFTIHKRDTSSMITIHTYVDGQYLNSY